MKNTLLEIIKEVQDPKNQDLEVQQFLCESLEEVLKKNNIDKTNNEIDEFMHYFSNYINYEKATDENLNNFFEALAKII